MYAAQQANHIKNCIKIADQSPELDTYALYFNRTVIGNYRGDKIIIAKILIALILIKKYICMLI